MAVEKQIKIQVTPSGFDQTIQDATKLSAILAEAGISASSMDSSIDALGDTLDDLNTSSKSAADGLNKIDDAAKATSKGLDGVKKSTDDVDNSMKNSKKSVLENGGAMGILNDLTGGLAMTFKDAVEATDLFSFSLKGVRGALIATGIGVFIIALGALIANWDEVRRAVTGANAATDALEDNISDLNASLTNTYKELIAVETAFDLARKGVISKDEALKTYNDTLGDNLGKAKTLNEAETLYAQKTDAYVQATLARAKAQVLLGKAAELQAKIATGEVKELTGFWQNFAAILVGEGNVAEKFAKKNTETAAEQVKVLTNAAKEALIEAEKLDKKFAITSENVAKNVEKVTAARREQIKAIEIEGLVAGIEKPIGDNLKPSEKEFEAKKELNDKEVELLLERLQKEKEIEEARQSIYSTTANAFAEASSIFAEGHREQMVLQEASLQMAKISADGQIDAQESVIAGMSVLSLAFKKHTTAYKALALASVAMDTAKGIMNVWGSQGTGNFIVDGVLKVAQTAVIGAAGIAQSKKILKTKTDGSLGGIESGGSGDSGGMAAPAAPQFNIVGQSSENQLASTIATQQNQPQRAYVVGQDVTTQQSMDRNLIQNATFIG